MFRTLLVLVSITCLSLAASRVSSQAETTSEIWRDEPGGWSRHVQSGFACPPHLMSRVEGLGDPKKGIVSLASVVVGDNAAITGDLVGCEYEGATGDWVTVEIRRLTNGTSADDVYSEMRDRIVSRFSDARREDELLNCRPKRPPNGRNMFCASYNHINVRGQSAVVMVVGGEVDGWAISLIQFNLEPDSTSLYMWGRVNWERIVYSRKLPVPPIAYNENTTR